MKHYHKIIFINYIIIKIIILKYYLLHYNLQIKVFHQVQNLIMKYCH